MRTNLTYFKRLIDGNDSASVKRFLGLVWSLYLMLASIVILFVKIPIANQELMDKALLYGFGIVFISILGISAQDFALIGVRKAEAIATGASDIIVENAQQVSTGTKAETVNAKNAETINTKTTNVENGPD